MGTREIIEKIVKERETDGGIKSVVWIAAGGSNGGNGAGGSGDPLGDILNDY